jgi:hypothetical protein
MAGFKAQRQSHRQSGLGNSAPWMQTIGLHQHTQAISSVNGQKMVRRESEWVRSGGIATGRRHARSLRAQFCPVCRNGVIARQLSESSVVFGVFSISGVFDLHVTKLFGVKDFATFQALNELTVFVAGNDSNPGVSADGRHRSYIKREIAFDAGIVARFSSVAKAYFVESSVPCQGNRAVATGIVERFCELSYKKLNTG